MRFAMRQAKKVDPSGPKLTPVRLWLLGPSTGAQVLTKIGLNMTERENFSMPVSSAGLIAIAAGRSRKDTPACANVTLRVSYAAGSVLAEAALGESVERKATEIARTIRFFMQLPRMGPHDRGIGQFDLQGFSDRPKDRGSKVMGSRSNGPSAAIVKTTGECAQRQVGAGDDAGARFAD